MHTAFKSCTPFTSRDVGVKSSCTRMHGACSSHAPLPAWKAALHYSISRHIMPSRYTMEIWHAPGGAPTSSVQCRPPPEQPLPDRQSPRDEGWHPHPNLSHGNLFLGTSPFTDDYAQQCLSHMIHAHHPYHMLHADGFPPVQATIWLAHNYAPQEDPARHYAT